MVGRPSARGGTSCPSLSALLILMSHPFCVLACHDSVVFGKVIDGMTVLKRIEVCGNRSGKPSRKVVIVDCGQVRFRLPGAGSDHQRQLHLSSTALSLLSRLACLLAAAAQQAADAAKAEAAEGGSCQAEAGHRV